jgi:hypothetical protein
MTLKEDANLSPVIEPKRGAIATPRHVIEAAPAYDHTNLLDGFVVPPNFIHLPPQISTWGSVVNADCVTAEEAFAKVCSVPPIFLPDPVVIGWASAHGVLQGAHIYNLMATMQNDGFVFSGHRFDDGPMHTVDFQNPALMAQAISQAPIKLGVSGNQLAQSWKMAGGNANGAPWGWFALGYQPDPGTDHCIGLNGYGAIGWLAGQLGVPVPANVNGAASGYSFYAWGSIGIIDVPSLLAIASEAWIRTPTTITR